MMMEVMTLRSDIVYVKPLLIIGGVVCVTGVCINVVSMGKDNSTLSK